MSNSQSLESSSPKKRNRSSFEALSTLTIESFKTPTKNIKTAQNNSDHNPLTDTEKSLAYLQHKTGTRTSKIAINLNRTSKTIFNFLKKPNPKTKFAPNHAAKGRWSKGRTKLTLRHKNLLKKWLENGTMHSARQCWIRLNKVKNLSRVSYLPVSNYLKTLGSFVRPKLKTLVSPGNRVKRLQYCAEYEEFNFRKVLFTDESSFQLNSNNVRAFKFKGHTPPRITKYNPNHKIMVWAGISYCGKTTLHFVEGKLNQDKYIEILANHREEMERMFRGRGRWYFQQDNAPCHKPQKVKSYIENYLGAGIIPHPPQSPDLNPIELIWAFMKTKVEEDRPRNKQELKTSIERAWRQVTLDLMRNCINNLPQKMKQVTEKNGDIL